MKGVSPLVAGVLLVVLTVGIALVVLPFVTEYAEQVGEEAAETSLATTNCAMEHLSIDRVWIDTYRNGVRALAIAGGQADVVVKEAVGLDSFGGSCSSSLNTIINRGGQQVLELDCAVYDYDCSDFDQLLLTTNCGKSYKYTLDPSTCTGPAVSFSGNATGVEVNITEEAEDLYVYSVNVEGNGTGYADITVPAANPLTDRLYKSFDNGSVVELSACGAEPCIVSRDVSAGTITMRVPIGDPEFVVRPRDEWWNSSWASRIKAEVYTGNYVRNNKVANAVLDLNSLAGGSFDNTSIRAVEFDAFYGNIISERPSKIVRNWDGNYTVKWTVDNVTDASTFRNYHIYFDTTDNGVKGEKDYFTQSSFSVTNQTGFPVNIVWNDWSSPRIVDLDSDGDIEIVVGADENLSVFNHDGTLLDGWPVSFDSGYLESPAAIGDMDNDGDLEVVAYTIDGEVYVFYSNGTRMPGWPVGTGYSARSGPGLTLHDVDYDGDLEIFVAVDDSVFAFHHDGTNISGFPVYNTIDASADAYYTIPNVADVDNDGYAEIAMHYWGYGCDMWKYYYNNNTVVNQSGWPLDSTTCMNNDMHSAMADIDSDGMLEYIVASEEDGYNLTAYNPDGSIVNGFPAGGWGDYQQEVSIGDIDGDGDLEIFYTSRYDPYGLITVSHDGILVNELTKHQTIVNGPYSGPIIADVDGDGDMEVITADGYKHILAWNSDGSNVTGLHEMTLPFDILSIPAVADIDNDGDIEIIISADKELHVLDSTGAYDHINVEWGMSRHDVWNSGTYDFDPYPLDINTGSVESY